MTNPFFTIAALSTCITTSLMSAEWISVGVDGPWQVKTTIHIGDQELVGYLAFIQNEPSQEWAPWKTWTAYNRDSKAGQAELDKHMHKSIRTSVLPGGVLLTVEWNDGSIRSALISPGTDSGSISFKNGVSVAYTNVYTSLRPLPLELPLVSLDTPSYSNQSDK